MLPANYYPAFKKYDHFVGNYGGSWWQQTTEFETFNGVILFTTNCIVPPKRVPHMLVEFTQQVLQVSKASHI